MTWHVVRRRSFGASSPVYAVGLLEGGERFALREDAWPGDDVVAGVTAHAAGERRFRLRFWGPHGELPFVAGAAIAAVAELAERGWMDRFGATLETAVGELQARHDRGRVAWLQLSMLRRTAGALPDPHLLSELLGAEIHDMPPLQRWRLGPDETALVMLASVASLEEAQPCDRAATLARELGLQRWTLHCASARDRLADVTLRSFEACGQWSRDVDAWGAAALGWAWHLEGKGRPQLTVVQPELGARILVVVNEPFVSIGGVTSRDT